MNYVLKSSIKDNRISLPLKILISITVAMIILHFLAPNFLSSFLTTIVKPFWNIENIIIYGDLTIPIETQRTIFTKLQKENEELKRLLGRTTENNFIIAQILKKPPFSAYDIFILDIGSDNDIKAGNKVYALGNILIGEIISTTAETSKVKLYSSFNEKYEVFISEKNILAEAIGRGGGSFEASLPRDIKVNEGDIVTIPSLSNSVFGTVKKVISDPARSFSTIFFSQPINIYEQRWVLIDTKLMEKDL